MGTLVSRKLSIFGPARRRGDNRTVCTVFAKQSLGQACKGGVRDGRLKEKGRRRAGLGGLRGSLFPGYRRAKGGGPLPRTASPQRPNHQMTR